MEQNQEQRFVFTIKPSERPLASFGGLPEGRKSRIRDFSPPSYPKVPRPTRLLGDVFDAHSTGGNALSRIPTSARQGIQAIWDGDFAARLIVNVERPDGPVYVCGFEVVAGTSSLDRAKWLETRLGEWFGNSSPIVQLCCNIRVFDTRSDMPDFHMTHVVFGPQSVHNIMLSDKMAIHKLVLRAIHHMLRQYAYQLPLPLAVLLTKSVTVMATEVFEDGTTEGVNISRYNILAATMMRIDMAIENGDDQKAASKMELFANFSLPEPLNGELMQDIAMYYHRDNPQQYAALWNAAADVWQQLNDLARATAAHLNILHHAFADLHRLRPNDWQPAFAHEAVMGLTDEYSSLWHSVKQTGAVLIEKTLMSWSNLIQMSGFNYSSGDDRAHGFGSTNMQGRTLSVKMTIEFAVKRAREDSAALPGKAKARALLLYLFRSTNDLDRFEKLMNACWEYWTDRSSDGAERRESAFDPELLAILAASSEQISSLRHDFVRCSNLTCLATPQLVPGTALSRNVGEPSMMSCPCHAVQYCSKACQRAHWKRHKAVCEHRKSSEKK